MASPVILSPEPSPRLTPRLTPRADDPDPDPAALVTPTPPPAPDDAAAADAAPPPEPPPPPAPDDAAPPPPPPLVVTPEPPPPPAPPPPNSATLKRKKSEYLTNQKTLKSCAGNASATMISRLFKLYFPNYFYEEPEWCDYYYHIPLCSGRIFDCLLHDKNNNECEAFNKRHARYANQAKQDILGLDITTRTKALPNDWNPENLSALLYYFIFNIIAQGVDFTKTSVLPEQAIPKFFEYFKKNTINSEKIKEILHYDELDDQGSQKYTPDEKEYFNTIINTFVECYCII